MASHTNYARLTASILSLTRYFSQVKNAMYNQFKEVIPKYNYDTLEESWENVPDCNELAKELGITKQRVYKLIKDFYSELPALFDVQPYKNCVCK